MHLNIIAFFCAFFTGAGLISPSMALQTPADYGWKRQAGWEEMCHRGDQPLDFCAPATGPGTIEDTPDLRALLEQVNWAVNSAYAYRSDAAMYGLDDYWTVPLGEAADCEDFVLLKIVHLKAAGVPRSAMSILAGNLKFGRWHSALVIHTSSGPLVLDNLHDEVRAMRRWRFDDAYVMSMRQPSRWWPI